MAGKAGLKVKEVSILCPASSAARLFLPINQDVDSLCDQASVGVKSPGRPRARILEVKGIVMLEPLCFCLKFSW